MNKPPRVKCPGCGAESSWSSANPLRPFCSQRCKDKDFIAWANEEQLIHGNSDYDDILSEDINP